MYSDKNDFGSGDIGARAPGFGREAVSNSNGDAAAGRCLKAWLGSIADLTTHEAELELKLLPVPRDRLPPANQPIEIRGRFGDGAIQIQAERALIEELLTHLPEHESLEELSATDTALLIEHVLTEIVTVIETRTGFTFEAEKTGVAPGRLNANALAAETITASGRYPVLIEIESHTVLSTIANLLERHAAPFGLDPRSSHPISVDIGPVALPTSDIKNLAEDDIIILEGSTDDHVGGVLALGDRPLFTAAIAGGTATLKLALDGPMQTAPDVVNLFFRFGSRDMAPRQLAELKPGSEFEFDRFGSNRVNMMVDGQNFGAGELMRVDGSIGIRITETKPQ